MKKVKLFLLVLLMHLAPSSILAEDGEFFFGLAARSGSFWISPFNAVALSKDISYDWISVSDEQGKIVVEDGSFWGFKARDMFRSFGIGVTFGYQPFFSPLGVYATAGYDFRQFRMQPDRSANDYEKYKPSSLNAGVGLRFAPLLLFNADADASPFVEISTRYNKVFSCKAPYGNAKDQFGSGFTTRFALGMRNMGDDELFSVFIYYDMPNYNYFNKDFTLDDGTKPYQNIEAKMHRIGIGLSMEF